MGLIDNYVEDLEVVYGKRLGRRAKVTAPLSKDYVYPKNGGNLRSKEPMKIKLRIRLIIAGEDRMDNPPTASCNT